MLEFPPEKCPKKIRVLGGPRGKLLVKLQLYCNS